MVSVDSAVKDAWNEGGRRLLGRREGPEHVGSGKKGERREVICKYENVTEKLIILYSRTYQ